MKDSLYVPRYQQPLHIVTTNEPSRELPLTRFCDLPIGTLFVIEGSDHYYSGKLCIRSHSSVVIIQNGDRWDMSKPEYSPRMPIRVLPKGTEVTIQVGDVRNRGN